MKDDEAHSQLHCDEEEEEQFTPFPISISDEDYEFLNILLDREKDSDWWSRPSVPRGQSHDWSFWDCIKSVRAEAFSWMLQTRELFRFQFHTAYLSMTYFDRFLSKTSPGDTKVWQFRFLAVICLSLAAKMEEPLFRVPRLWEYKFKDDSFVAKDVLGIELIVLNILEWRISSITPFLFLHFFASMFYEPHLRNELFPKTVQLIFSVTTEINVVDHRPSTVAAAAVLATSEKELTKESLGCKLNLDPFCARLDVDAVFSCYGIMQRLYVDKFLNVGPATPPNPTTSMAPSNNSSVSSLLASSAASSSDSKKRKRLASDKDDDQNSCNSPADEK